MKQMQLHTQNLNQYTPVFVTIIVDIIIVDQLRLSVVKHHTKRNRYAHNQNTKKKVKRKKFSQVI